MKTSTSYINGKCLAFKEAEFIDWWVASPCSERGDARTGVTPVKSYSSFVWASWQLICYLIGDERVGKIQATGRQCSMDLAVHANHQHCNWWHKSQQAAAFSELYKTPGVVHPCQLPNENILACWAWEIAKPPSRSSVRVLTPDHLVGWGWACAPFLSLYNLQSNRDEDIDVVMAGVVVRPRTTDKWILFIKSFYIVHQKLFRPNNVPSKTQTWCLPLMLSLWILSHPYFITVNPLKSCKSRIENTEETF